MKELRIVSDGTGGGTHIFLGDEKVRGVSKIEISAIESGSKISATLTFERVSLDIVARKMGVKVLDSPLENCIEQVLLDKIDN